MNATLKPLVTAADCSGEWIGARREIILRDGYALRAGDWLTIEIKSLRDNRWMLLSLPNDAPHFASTEDRDAVLARLQGVAQP